MGRLTHKSKVRILTLTVAVIVLSVIAFVIISNPVEVKLLPCLIHSKFNVKCPSCGLTRAVYCVMTLKLGQAFYYNAYLTLLSPLVAYLCVAFLVNGVVGRRIVPLPKFRWWMLVAFLVGLIAFTVLRNFISCIY